MSALSERDRALLERIGTALEDVARELRATRGVVESFGAVLETMPDRRDLLEAVVAGGLALGTEQLTPAGIAERVAAVGDAVWETVHGETPKGGGDDGPVRKRS